MKSTKGEPCDFVVDRGLIRPADQWNQTTITRLFAATGQGRELGHGLLVPGDTRGELFAKDSDYLAPARFLVDDGFVRMVHSSPTDSARGALHLTTVKVEIGPRFAAGMTELRPFQANRLAIESEGEPPLVVRLFVYGARREGRLTFTCGPVNCAVTLADRELPADALEIVSRGARGQWWLDNGLPFEIPRWAQGPAATTADILPN